MKYKPRYTWERRSRKNKGELEAWEEANDEVYWDTLWYAEDSDSNGVSFVVLHVPGEGYFAGPNEPNTPRSEDRGPYRHLIEAKAVAETLIALNGSST